MKAMISLLLLFATVALNAQTMKGDMNGDNKMTIADATSVVDVVLGNTSQQNISFGDNPYPVDNCTFAECAKAADDHEYVDLGLPSGTLWATCNIGASSPEDYGNYFAWGETRPYAEGGKTTFSWKTYKWGALCH